MTKLITDAGSQVDVPEDKAQRLLAGSGFHLVDGQTAPQVTDRPAAAKRPRASRAKAVKPGPEPVAPAPAE